MRNELKKTIIAGIIWALLAFVLFFSFLTAGEGIKDDAPRYRVEPELKGYVTSFVNLAKLKGIDLSYIYTQDVTVVWEVALNKNSTNVATSYGRNKDKIIIVVNKERFMARTEEGRKYVMFHELGHDILNFEHLKSPDRGMMEPTAYSGFFKNYERFSQETQQSYLYKSLNKMFDRYISPKGDAISDSTKYGIEYFTTNNKDSRFVHGWSVDISPYSIVLVTDYDFQIYLKAGNYYYNAELQRYGYLKDGSFVVKANTGTIFEYYFKQ